MKTTKKLLSLLAMVAITLSCSTKDPGEEPEPPTPPTPPTTETKYPTDTNPTKFDNFFKRTMFIQHTGTGCQYCPAMTVALNKAEESADADKIVPVIAHNYNSSDPMYNQLAVKYKTVCGISGAPNANLDLRKTADAKFEGGDVNAKIIAKCDALEAKYPAKVAIAAAVEVENNEFVVYTGVKIGVAGSYNIGIIVLEDNVKATQSNKGYKGYDFNIHKHAARGSMPSLSVIGSPLQEGLIDAGKLIEKTFRVPLPAKTKLENAKIVVFVSCPDKEGGDFYINNTVVCKPGSPVGFKYKE